MENWLLTLDINALSILKFLQKLPPLDYITWVNKHRFQKIKGKKIYVWTDGSCNNFLKINVPAGIGVWFGMQDPRNLSEPFIEEGRRTTNNRAELQAIHRALESILGGEEEHKNLVIVTDSEFCIKSLLCIYKNKDNMDLLEKIIHNLEKLYYQGWSITFKHVRGHQRCPEDKNSWKYFWWYGNFWADIQAKIGYKIAQEYFSEKL